MSAADPRHPALVPLLAAGCRVRAVARTASTQVLAHGAVRGGAGPWWCAVAAEQTAGRGRQGRPWTAPEGTALLTSVVVPALRGGWAALGAGVAVRDAVTPFLGRDGDAVLGLKWPNDVLAGGRKVAGILVEVPPRHPELAIVGVGIDLQPESAPPGGGAVSLAELMGMAPPPPVEAVLAALLGALRARWAEAAADGGFALAAEWRRRSVGLGGPVRAMLPRGRVLDGVAEGVDEDGALLVRGPAGLERLVAADVHIGTDGTATPQGAVPP